MTGYDDDKSHEWHERLLRAVREVGKETDPTFSRPSDTAITAYFLGTADTDQIEEVQQALEKSASFRREMLDLVRDLQSLTVAETRSANLLARSYGRLMSVYKDSVERAARTLEHVATNRTALAAVVVVVLVLAAVWVWKAAGPSIPIVTMETVASDLPSSELIALTSRGLDSAVAVYAVYSPDSAAIMEFRRHLVLDSNYSLVLLTDSTCSQPISAAIVMHLRNRAGKTVAVLGVPKPAGSSIDSTWSLWMVGISEKHGNTILKAPVTGDTMNLRWIPAFGDKGVVCIVHETPAGYESAPGRPFVISDHGIHLK